MADRRVGDRRSPEEGVIKVPFEQAIIYLVIATVLIVSLAANVVLVIRNKEYKRQLQEIQEIELTTDDESIEYDLEEDEDEEDEEDEEESNEEDTETEVYNEN